MILNTFKFGKLNFIKSSELVWPNYNDANSYDKSYLFQLCNIILIETKMTRLCTQILYDDVMIRCPEGYYYAGVTLTCMPY